MMLPNFFIVGAPKCGTTSLSEYLRDHPHVVMAQPKEPHYFASDLPAYRDATTEEEYLAMFRGISERTLAVGEASVFYLFSKTAIPQIREFNPQAKLIAIVRNPLELVPSFHAHRLLRREEDVGLAEALQLEDERRAGRALPRHCLEPALLQYTDLARLGAQLERLLEVFPREQVKIVVFDDFCASPKAVYEDVLSFLGVPSDGRTDFPVVNPGREYRWRPLATFTEKTSEPLIRVALGLKRALGLRDLRVLDTLRRLNTREAERNPLSPELRSQLIDEFREDVSKLSQIIGRDLSAAWLV